MKVLLYGTKFILNQIINNILSFLYYKVLGNKEFINTIK